MDENSVTLEVALPPGTPLERTQTVLEEMKKAVEKDISEYKDIILTSGTSAMMGSTSSYKGKMEIVLSDEKGADTDKENKKQTQEVF